MTLSHLHVESYFYMAASLLLLYLCGAWVTFLIHSKTIYAQFWAWTPLFGVIVFPTLVANASYAGMSTKGSAVLIAAALTALSLWLWLKRRPLPEIGWNRAACGAGLLAICIFITPYALTGAFPMLGDAFTYVSIADFLKDQSYFASAEPAHVFPWQSQMLLYQQSQFRMGAQYLLSSYSALMGVKAVAAYVPTAAVLLYAGFCGMWLLAEALLVSAVARWFAYGMYVLNLMMVYWPVALNMLPQSGGVALVSMFMAALVLATHMGPRGPIVIGLILSGLCFFYPEIVPIALAAGVLFHVMCVVRRVVPVSRIVRLWAAAAVVAVLANPYSFYCATQALLLHMKVRSGFPFNMSFLTYVRWAFGVMGFAEWPAPFAFASIGIGLLFAAVAVLGLLRFRGPALYVMVAGALVHGTLWFYLKYIADYSYGAYKVVFYSYYLVPLAFGLGIAELLARVPRRRAALGIAAALVLWIPAALVLNGRFLSTAYGMTQHSVYSLGGPVTSLNDSLADLETVTGVVQDSQKTLLAIPEDYYNKWATYYFRKPVGLYYIGPFFGVLAGRTLPNDVKYDYILLNQLCSSVKDPARVIMQNRLFVFSVAQPFIQTTEKGWYELELVNGRAVRWMQNRGELLAYTRDPEKIRLTSNVYLGPDRKPKTLAISLDGADAGAYPLTVEKNALVTGELALSPGFHKIVLETKEQAGPLGPDPRTLNLLFEAIEIQRAIPSRLRSGNAEELRAIGGLTPDAWVTGGGITFSLPNRPQSRVDLVVRGEVPNVPGIAPQTLTVELAGGVRRSTSIPKIGNFVAVVPLGTFQEDILRVGIKPSRTFVPKALGLGLDSRALGIRLESVEIIAP